MTRTNGEIAFTWTAVRGLSYQVQYCENLPGANWFDLGTPIVATNSIASGADSIELSGNRFYRVGMQQ